MNKESSFESGRCQCGDITYTLDKNKVISTHHCHCKDCQRTTGSGKATILFIAKKYVDLNGELKFFESKGSSGSHVRRGFCPNCGSGILSYSKEISLLIMTKATINRQPEGKRKNERLVPLSLFRNFLLLLLLICPLVFFACSSFNRVPGERYISVLKQRTNKKRNR